tara:strand:- start:949 stop:1494 length:546 start_codon:yes stop_codon:yes gene_type:complete
MKTEKKKEHYVNNKEFLAAMVEYKKLCIEAEDAGEEKPPVTNYIGECFLKIANHLSYRPNFINYTFRDDMISDGIENCLQYLDNFNPDKSNNPFAYFTQIIYYAFIRRIQKEKKQANIKAKLIAEGGYEDMAVNEGDDGHYRNQYSEFLQKHTTADEVPIKRTRKRKGKLDEFLNEDSPAE